MDIVNQYAHGLGLSLAVFGAAVGAAAGVINWKKEMDMLKNELDVERTKRDAAIDVLKKDLDVEKAKRDAAIAKAEKETAEKFLRYGFTEEYRAYQRLVGIDHEKKKIEGEKKKTV